MRIRDKKLEAELINTRNEFTAYTAKPQKEHQVTREEVVRIFRQRKVDGEEWGKYTAQAKERDQLLTKKIAEMEEELRKARIIPTERAGTTIGESLMEERLHTLPSEGGGGNGRGPPRPPNVAGHPIKETMTLTTRVTIGPETSQVMILGDQHLVRIKHRIQQKQRGFLKY